MWGERVRKAPPCWSPLLERPGHQNGVAEGDAVERAPAQLWSQPGLCLDLDCASSQQVTEHPPKPLSSSLKQNHSVRMAGRVCALLCVSRDILTCQVVSMVLQEPSSLGRRIQDLGEAQA